MYPHERSLVERMQGRPFALLGVNSDEDRDKLKETIEKENITWRSWWDGSITGPIATQWNIMGWPTTYLIDHRGIIRGRVGGSKETDKRVDELVKQAEAIEK